MKISPVFNLINHNSKILRNNICFKGNSEQENDTFVASEPLTKEEQKEINKKRAKLRDTLWKAICHNDVEGLKAIIYGKDVYKDLLHTANRYYDSMLRSENSPFGHGKKVNHEMGDIIYKALLDEKLKEKNNIQPQTNPYTSIVHDVRYGLTNQFTMSVLKKAFETKDATLLRLTIETLRDENKPFEKMLLDVVDDIKEEKDSK